jgi:hypothetical protein
MARGALRVFGGCRRGISREQLCSVGRASCERVILGIGRRHGRRLDRIGPSLETRPSKALASSDSGTRSIAVPIELATAFSVRSSPLERLPTESRASATLGDVIADTLDSDTLTESERLGATNVRQATN